MGLAQGALVLRYSLTEATHDRVRFGLNVTGEKCASFAHEPRDGSRARGSDAVAGARDDRGEARRSTFGEVR